jgi:hypothetical protein
LGVSRIRPENLDLEISNRAVAADVLSREEPGEEEDEEDDNTEDEEEGEGEDEDDGYSE